MPEIDFSIPLQYYQQYIAIGIVLGAVWCFFGYKIFRFVLGILGFIAGALAAGAIGYELSEGREIYAIASAIVGGLLGAGIMFMLYIVGVFVIGALLGALTALSVFTYLNQEPEYLTIIVAALVAGIVAVFIKRFMIILATSLTGAWAVVTGLAYFVENNFDPFHPDTILKLTENELYRILIIWFALSMAGLTVQYITSAKDYKPESDSVPDESESDTGDKEIIELDEPYVEPTSEDSPDKREP